MILASQSPRRVQLLREAGVPFRALPAHIDEGAVHQPTPRELARTLAEMKARALTDQAAPREAVIGADTVVSLGDTVFGKPADADEARAMLAALSGATHEVVTAVAIERDGCGLCTFEEIARVTFWDITPREIDEYIATGEPFDKAGAYGIQGAGRLLVKRIEGDFYTVMGLPIARLVRVLRNLGLAA